MAIFMLHFDCVPNRPGTSGQRVTADACVIGETLELAETLAREEIQENNYQADALIAYAQVDKTQVVELDDYETVLYLKAMQKKPSVAVMFT